MTAGPDPMPSAFGEVTPQKWVPDPAAWLQLGLRGSSWFGKPMRWLFLPAVRKLQGSLRAEPARCLVPFVEACRARENVIGWELRQEEIFPNFLTVICLIYALTGPGTEPHIRISGTIRPNGLFRVNGCVHCVAINILFWSAGTDGGTEVERGRRV